MKLSTVHKQRLSRIGRVVLAGAMVVGSVSTAAATPADALALFENRTIISDSRPGQTNTGYDIRFYSAAASTTAIGSVDVRFCEASGSWDSCDMNAGLALNPDISSAVAEGFGGTAGATSGTFTRVDDNEFTFEVDTPGAETDAIEKRLNLAGLVANPSAGVYYTMVRTYDASDNLLDEGTSAFAIVAKVDVTGRVAENMTFSVAGVTNGQTCGGENAMVTSTATTVPFGNFTSGTPRVACQSIQVSTNAESGYTASIRHVRIGTSPMGGMCRQTSADCTANGAASTTPVSDVIVDNGLSGTIASWTNGTTTGVGLNANGTQAAAAYGGNASYVSMFGSAREVATSTAPTGNVPTLVKFKADVPATQTAGVYQNSLEYIVTPTF